MKPLPINLLSNSNKWRALFQNLISAVPTKMDLQCHCHRLFVFFLETSFSDMNICVWMYVCVYLFMKSSFPMISELGMCMATSIFELALNAVWKRVFQLWIYEELFTKRVKWACNANAKFKDCVLLKSFSHMYIWVYMYIFMNSSFPKYDLQTWHWHCNIDFWIGT